MIDVVAAFGEQGEIKFDDFVISQAR